MNKINGLWFKLRLWQFKRSINHIVCKLRGHKYPLERKLWCSICPRCKIVVAEKSKVISDE